MTRAVDTKAIEGRLSAVSKYADMIAVNGDPLKDVTIFQRVKVVMKGGGKVK